MTQRDTTRPFDRSPAGVDSYINRGGGSYGQFNLTGVWQATDGSSTDLDQLLNANVDFSGGWATTPNSLLTWWISGGRPVGNAHDADLSKAVGSGLGINATLQDDLDLKELYWAQIINSAVHITFGLIDSTWRYDINATANSEREYFLSPALNNSAAIPFPNRSLAADFRWEINTLFDLQAGFYQNNCTDDSEFCLDNLDDDHWFSPVELIADTHHQAWGEGLYRILVFWTQQDDKKGYGASVNLEQSFGPVTPFLRLSIADREISEFKEFASVGITLAAPFSRTDDTLGIGWAWGKPSAENRRSEQIIEAYWRLQLNRFFSVSPHLQLVVDPVDNPDETRAFIGGVRLQLDL